MPSDASAVHHRVRAYGAHVTLVDGLITDAGRMAAEQRKTHGWFDVSTLKEPYRVEGKKTMGYELAEQLDWTLPDVILYPTGGGTGLIGMWKAFDEMGRGLDRAASGRAWSRCRPRAARRSCAPSSEGGEQAELWENADTMAAGLRVPEAIGDFLILAPSARAAARRLPSREPAMVKGMFGDRRLLEGISAAPEGGAALVAPLARAAGARAASSRTNRVVLFNTGGALKYLDVLRTMR